LGAHNRSTIVSEQNEKTLGKTDKKNHVNDAEAKDIVEEHLVDHDHERASETEWHCKE
jgi:hypothetical protein